MKKKINLLIIAIILSACVLSFAACDYWHEVTFDTQDGNPANTQLYQVGTKHNSCLIDKPTDPQRDNYIFGGWYKESECENKWDFDTDKATKDITLYAKWIAGSYSVILGAGSETNPYKIATAAQLRYFANELNTNYSVRNYSDKYFELNNDIDLDGAEWTPIGFNSTYRYFGGNFNGNGYTISNFIITSQRVSLGLFGYNQGTIKNLGVKDFRIEAGKNEPLEATEGTFYVGGLLGRNNGGEVTNCYADGVINVYSDISATMGGLIGFSDFGIIADCYAIVSINNTGGTGSSSGGLIGFNRSAITNCFATGNINARSSAGGLIGSNEGATIIKCYATGDANAIMKEIEGKPNYANSYAGGLIGYNGWGLGYNGGHAYSVITESYAIGDVNATAISCYAYAGGLVGDNVYGTLNNCYAIGDVQAESDRSFSFAGGLTGASDLSYSGEVVNCYAVGNVIAESNASPTETFGFAASAGGLIGRSIDNGIENCFATGDVSAVSHFHTSYVGGLIGDSGNNQKTNCYRYSEQTISRIDISGTYSTASNTLGTECLLAQLDSVSFYTDTLDWSINIWNLNNLDFANNKYPTLK